MHDRVVIVCLAERIDVILGQLVEIIFLTGHNIDFVDNHVVLAIWSCVLVPEADYVTKLVNNNSKFIAILADGNRLRTLATFSHKRTATLKAD